MLARVARWSGYGDARMNALDIGRGIAILAVIYGHALAPWFMSAGAHFSEGAFIQWKFGAAFMMAFFFFLSGASWREEKSFETTLRQAGTLVIIAWLASAVFEIGHLAISLAGLAETLHAEPITPLQFLRRLARMAVYGDAYSLSALWFLAALGVVRVAAAVLRRFGPAATAAGATLLLAATLASTEFGWRNVYQLNLIGVALVCFLAGHAVRSQLALVERRPAAAYGLLLLSGAVLVATFHLNEGCRWDVAARCGVDWLNDRFGVSMIIGQFGNLAMFAVSAAAGIGFASAISILLARFGGVVAARLEAWGRNSLNLLVTNCLFLHVGNIAVAVWVVPRVSGEGVIFFIGLFALTLAANLIAADILARPLRRLHMVSSRLAARIVAIAAAAAAWMAVARRGDRVTQSHD